MLEPNPESTIKQDLQEFHRRCELAYHFHKKPPSQATPFTATSTWRPHRVDSQVLQFQSDLQHRVSQFPKLQNNQKHPLAKAIKSLANNKHIIIKSADKGAATVIMDNVAYYNEALNQLGNPLHYTLLQGPIFHQVTDTLNDLLDQLVTHKFITKQQKAFLRVSGQARERKFYLLPKLHKPLHNWPGPGTMPPGRPIVSDTGSESYQLSKFLAATLHPLATKHPSYVKDTPDFIQKITADPIPPHSILATLDVSSLYTNIDSTMGLQAVRQALENSGAFSQVVIEILLHILDILLAHNDFTFAKKWFLQILGTAMGKPFAPEYANLAMWAWETIALRACSDLPFKYLRYLDDIFIVWTHTREKLHTFHTTLNSISTNIQLTMEASSHTINFLDTTIFKGARFLATGVLDTRVFFKPTDTHSLLHATSFHPPHTFKGIALSQAIRYIRNCTSLTEARQAYHQLSRTLIKRGYSRTLLHRALHRALRGTPTYVPQASPCLSSGCSLCTTHWNHHPQPLPNPPDTRIHCHTPSIVYIITCKNCRQMYVGQSGDNLAARIGQHLHNIRTHGDTPVAQHFNTGTCKGTANLLAHPILHFPVHPLPDMDDSLQERLVAEANFIRHYKTLQPRGMNRYPIKYPPTIPLVTTFHPHTGLLRQATKQTYHRVLTLTYPTLFTVPPLMSLRRNKSTRDKVVRALYSSPPASP